jgi:hypothetical protein
LPETRIAYSLYLASHVAPGQPLDEVAITGILDFKPSAEPVSRETEAPDEGRIIPGTRQIEMNTNKWLNYLVEGTKEWVVEPPE